MKIERGVMVIKNGRAWGKVYEDGRSTEYGWMCLEDAPIRDPKYCHKPQDVTHRGDVRGRKELADASLVWVTRRTEVLID